MTTAIDQGEYADAWERWHSAYERLRSDRLGFLTITGLHWLTEDPQQITGAPGRWSTGPDGIVVELGPGEELTLDDDVVIRGRHVFGPLGERESLRVGFADDDAEGAIEVMRRGGNDVVRPHRSDHPYRAAYPGTPAFSPDARWRIPARFVPFDQPQRTEVGSVVDGLQHVYEARGRIVFDHDGETFSLTAFPGRAPGSLLVLFTDATSGVTTYGALRSLTAPAPDEEGWTVIDFNHAVNMPCAYTDFATCPMPPVGNRLPFEVTAGEKIPLARMKAFAGV